MAATVERFVRNLIDSGLMSEHEFRSFETSRSKAQTIQELALALVESQRLTRYQANMLAKDKVNGLILGNYEILDVLGQGGMGMVFKARHRRMDRLVAVKVLPPKATKDVEQVRRFQREVRAAAKLTHRNIVPAHDADEAMGVHFLVMEFVDGRDLSGIVRVAGPLPVPQAVNYVVQAAAGLEYAHAAGIIHRDIKPSNLLLNKHGVVKVLDMGLARFDESFTQANVPVSGEGQPHAITQSGNIMGTVDFMAPEQAINTRRADHRADIYSLGCTLFYLLTGKPVYFGETMMETLVAHQNHPIPSLTEARRDVPAGLDAIFQKMLAKAPSERYQSMGEVITVLTPFAGEPSGEFKKPLVIAAAGEHVDAAAETVAWLSSLGENKVRLSESMVNTSSSIGDVTMIREAKSKPKPRAGRQTGRRSKLDRQKVIALAACGLALLAVGLASVLSKRTNRDANPLLTPNKESQSPSSTPVPADSATRTDSVAASNTPATETKPPAVQSPAATSAAKRNSVLLVISQNDFWYSDYDGVRKELERGGMTVRVASSGLNRCRPNSGSTGGGDPDSLSVQPDLAIWDAKAADYDAIIVSGAINSGLAEFDGDSRPGKGLKRVVEEFIAEKKTVAAICGGPAILASTGVLSGIEITCYHQAPEVKRRVKQANVIPKIDQDVHTDGLFITGRSWEVATEFTHAVLEKIKSQ
jgi:serine/threonine protein kinase